MPERRAAARVRIPEGLQATVTDVPVEVYDLSPIGARVVHRSRFPLSEPRIRIEWSGMHANIPCKVIRSEIIGNQGGALIYQTAFRFGVLDPVAEGVVADVLRWAAQSWPAAPAETVDTNVVPQVAAERAPERIKPAQPSLDDSWVRTANFFRYEEEPEDELPYAQFRLTEAGWVKEYVREPDQPENGFTLRRSEKDFAALQKTYELADEDTRRMMRIAFGSQLQD